MHVDFTKKLHDNKGRICRQYAVKSHNDIFNMSHYYNTLFVEKVMSVPIAKYRCTLITIDFVPTEVFRNYDILLSVGSISSLHCKICFLLRLHSKTRVFFALLFPGGVFHCIFILPFLPAALKATGKYCCSN